MQLNFFKRLLGLQRTTAGFLIRLELNVTGILVKVFHRAYKFIERILMMPESRLPHVCLSQQLRMFQTGTAVERFNWPSQVNRVLAKIEKQCMLNDLDVLCWRANEISTIEKLKSYLKSEDLMLYRNYASHNVHIDRALHDNLPPYLCSRMPFNVVKTLAQLRLSSSLFVKLSVKGNTYRIEQGATCLNCNRIACETLKHIVFDCPLYSPYRDFYLKNYI